MGKLIDAATRGDRLQTLKELRDLLALRLEESHSDRDISSMSKRLVDIIAEIENLETDREEQPSALDELRKRVHIVR